MRKIAVVLAFVAVLSLSAPPARADVVVIAAATGLTTSSTYPIGPATKVTVTVQSLATSSCTVLIKQKLPSSDTWITMSTINNPTASGEIWSGAGGGQFQVEISAWTSGTIKVVMEAWAGSNQLF
jgi:hypothetical protein